MIKFLLFFITCFFQGALGSASWTIVANGPPQPLEDLKLSFHDRTVVVLDGAINRLKAVSFYPHCLLGDFDSIENPEYWGVLALFSEITEQSTPYIGNFEITIIPAKDQNYTDLEKGIIYCDAGGASSIYIVQATGGRMDHTLGNLGLLRKYHQIDRELIIFTESEQIFYLCDNDIFIEGGVGEYCAIMGYPHALLSTSGLSYDTSNYPLKLGIQESICNVISHSQATISIRGAALVILPKACTFRILNNGLK